jgi:4'-phosphopantetheinyl transferase
MTMFRSWPAATEGQGSARALAPDRVDCWGVSLTDFPAGAEAVAAALLSADERERAARFHFERHQTLYIRAHAALRLILARYLGVAPASLCIVPDATGRPILAPAAGLHFNLSHSGDAALVAVACSAPVGVDIEVVREIADFVAIARRHFAPAEVDDLLRLPPEQQRDGFYVTWTRKEAFVKALGLGLSFPLGSFCTGAQDRAPRLTQVTGALYSDWSMADLAPADGYKAAVAVHQPGVAIDCRDARWPWLLDGLHTMASRDESADACGAADPRDSIAIRSGP